jgi:hypothetical protein
MSDFPIHNINKQLVTSQSVAASFNTNLTPLAVDECNRLAVQVVVTGTATGTIQVTCSNDGINFVADPENPTPLAVTGTNFDGMIKISNCSYPYVSVNYVASAGTGTMTVTVSGKAQ